MSDNQLFDASYHRLFGHGVGIDAAATPFFETFYQHFLVNPDVGALFNETDMPHQVGMLRKSLFTLITFYATNRPSSELERLAALHTRLGVTDDHYDRWLEALITTVRQHDAQCDLATELAWRWALTPGLTYMRLYDFFCSNPPQMAPSSTADPVNADNAASGSTDESTHD